MMSLLEHEKNLFSFEILQKKDKNPKFPIFSASQNFRKVSWKISILSGNFQQLSNPVCLIESLASFRSIKYMNAWVCLPI
jgi:hypothetical protein